MISFYLYSCLIFKSLWLPHGSYFGYIVTGFMAANINSGAKHFVGNEIDTSPPLVVLQQWFPNVASSINNGGGTTVFISLKLVFACRALISTTCDISLSGSGLIKLQNKVKGRQRKLPDSFELIKVASWAGLCLNCLLRILALRGLTSLVGVRQWISSTKDSPAFKFSNYMPLWKENMYDYDGG